MIKYNMFGAASGGEYGDLRGERVYLGGVHNRGDAPVFDLKDSGSAGYLLAGLCSSGHERNAGRVSQLIREANAGFENGVYRSGRQLIEDIIQNLPRENPFPYAALCVSDGGVCAAAAGGAVIYEFSDGRLKLLTSGGKIAVTRPDNLLAVPKVFIGLSREVAECVNRQIIEMYMSSGGDMNSKLRSIMNRAELTDPGFRKSAFIVTAETEVAPIYADSVRTPSDSGTGRPRAAGLKSRSNPKNTLLGIALWSAAVVAFVVLICLILGGRFGGA